MSNLSNRMMRAARLDVDLYEEVEADKDAMGQAVAAIILSSMAAGIATIAVRGVGGVVLEMIGALFAWVVWACLTYLIGTRILPEPQTKADVGQILRTLGFASSPGVIRVVGIVPGLMRLSFLVAAVWMFVAMVIAVRQALDYTSTVRAIGVCLIGFLVQVVILAVVFAALGGLGV